MRKKVIIVSFIVILFGFSIAHIILPDQKISISERRTYKTLPTFKFEVIEKLMIEFYNKNKK